MIDPLADFRDIVVCLAEDAVPISKPWPDADVLDGLAEWLPRDNSVKKRVSAETEEGTRLAAG